MKIGIIGTGYIGGLITKKLVAAGYEVVVSNSKGPESLAAFVKETGPAAVAVSTVEAANNEVVIFAVKWEGVTTVLEECREALAGKILIDVTNPILKDGSYVSFEGSSASETIAALVPQTKVVKAFNSLIGAWIEGDPQVGQGRKVVLVSGDHPQSNETVSGIIEKTGFFPLTLGSLQIGGLVQQAGKPLAAVNLIRVAG
ncbi:MAG: NAD(P)-binding domain-containing protein [Bacteroidota bacterium]|nr:NAD(P)-binding domain-containing protein [Bacteroidota bacterium]